MLFGRKPLLPENLENALVSYWLEKELFGLTTEDAKRKTFQLAVKNIISHPFSGKGKKVGWKWFHGFMPHIRRWIYTSHGRHLLREQKVLH
jgi:hypothetical protein